MQIGRKGGVGDDGGGGDGRIKEAAMVLTFDVLNTGTSSASLSEVVFERMSTPAFAASKLGIDARIVAFTLAASTEISISDCRTFSRLPSLPWNADSLNELKSESITSSASK